MFPYLRKDCFSPLFFSSLVLGSVSCSFSCSYYFSKYFYAIALFFFLPLPLLSWPCCSPSLTFPLSRLGTLKVCPLNSIGAVGAPSSPHLSARNKMTVFPIPSFNQPAIICLTRRDTQSPEVCDGDSGHCIAFPNGSRLQRRGH